MSAITFTVAGMAPLPDHIKQSIRVSDQSGCWLWQKSLSPDGYGWSSYKNKTYQAHRLVYLLLCGDPLPGLVIDHLCRNRHCVNPAHMELVTPRENIRRSPIAPSGQEHCLKCGGEFHIIGKTKPQRRCVACAKEWKRQYNIKNRERIAASNREWKAANPEKWREIQRRSDAKRRALKQNG